MITHLFIRKIINCLYTERKIIYIDECSFSNCDKSYKSWVNTHKAEVLDHPGRMKSVNLIMGITSDSIVYHKILDTCTNS